MKRTAANAGVLVAVALAGTLPARLASAQDRARCIETFDEGQHERLAGALKAARTSFLTCAADSCPALLRKDCAQALTQLDTDLPTIVLGARDPAGNDLIPTAAYVDEERVTTFDGRALAEDPGPHTIRFEHPPDAPVVEHVVLRVGERNRAILATFGTPVAPPAVERPAPSAATVVAPVARSGRPSGWAYVAGGVGLLGLASFATFGLAGFVEKQHLLATCAPTCADWQVAHVRFDYITGDTSLAVGLVSLGIATYLFLSPPSSSAGLSVAPSRDGLVVGWREPF